MTSISVRGFLALYSSSALNNGVRSVNTLPTSVSTMSELRCGIDLQELAEAERQVVERAHEPAEAVHGAARRAKYRRSARRDVRAGGEPRMDGIGRHLAALEREKHAGGEERIEERERVAHQAEAVAADVLRVIQVLAGHTNRLHLLADR